MRRCIVPGLLLFVVACGGTDSSPSPGQAESKASPTAKRTKKVGYDIRRIRPQNDQPLAEVFDRVHAQARAEGKLTAVLFSAGWCAACRDLELELGNFQSAADIAHIRIFELKEEDWEAVTRMNEFNNLRRRWYPALGSYPVFIVLDEDGEKIEEMREAIERLKTDGVEPTVANWFRGIRPRAS